MWRRMHPAIVDAIRRGAHGDVFGDAAEAGSGGSDASFQAWLARKLMRDGVLLGHERGMFSSGASDGGVPGEGRQAARDALTVRGFEEDSLGSGVLGVEGPFRGEQRSGDGEAEREEQGAAARGLRQSWRTFHFPAHWHGP